MVLSWHTQSLRCSIHLTAGASLDDIRSCRWPGSLVLLVSLSFWLSVTFWFSPCLSVSGVHQTVRSLPVSPHYYPVCNPGYHNGSDTLATLGSSAVGFCPIFRCPCGVMCAWQWELVLMISNFACGLDPSSYLLPFGWNDTMCRVAGPLLPGFPPSLASSLYTLSALQVSVVVPIRWTPSARLPSGSVMAFAVAAVFYATVSEA